MATTFVHFEYRVEHGQKDKVAFVQENVEQSDDQMKRKLKMKSTIKTNI